MVLGPGREGLHGVGSRNSEQFCNLLILFGGMGMGGGREREKAEVETVSAKSTPSKEYILLWSKVVNTYMYS